MLQLGEKFLHNLVSSRDGPVKSTKMRQGWKHAIARRLCYGTMVEKKGKVAFIYSRWRVG